MMPSACDASTVSLMTFKTYTFQLLIPKTITDLTNHSFAYSAEDEKAEDAQKSLKGLVDVTGIEPVTPCLQSRCSPS
jgi:hypothetical protein